MSVDIVILAAGHGTRMKSDLPKVLHPVAGRAMIQEVIGTARAVGGREIVVVVGHGAEQVRAAAGNEVTFALQKEQLGTGHAVMQAAKHLLGSDAETVLVLYGDSPLITASTLKNALATHTEQGSTITLLSFIPQDPTGYGRIIRDENGRVTGIVEQRNATDAEKQIRESNSGFMLFDSTWLWNHLPLLGRSEGGEFYLTDLSAMAVAEGGNVEAIQIFEREVLGVNDRIQLAAASSVLWNRRRDFWMSAGVTMVDPATVWIEAEVTIGADTTLQPNVYLKGFTTIGAKCTIGAYSILDNARIAEGTTVAPRSTLLY